MRLQWIDKVWDVLRVFETLKRASQFGIVEIMQQPAIERLTITREKIVQVLLLRNPEYKRSCLVVLTDRVSSLRGLTVACEEVKVKGRQPKHLATTSSTRRTRNS